MAIVMTLDEVAQFLKVHPSTVYRLLKQHSIPAFKLGSDWRFNQESIERWLETMEADRSAETGETSPPLLQVSPKRPPSSGGHPGPRALRNRADRQS
jgi:excisionase family DNA binding protein